MNFHLKILLANLGGGKGGTFLDAPGGTSACYAGHQGSHKCDS